MKGTPLTPAARSRDQPLSDAGPSPCPLNFPLGTLVTRAQAMVQAKQPLLRTRYFSRRVSPLILSAPSKVPNWKFLVGRKPWALITFTSTGVPYMGRPWLVTGEALSLPTASRQAALNSRGRATFTGRVPRATMAFTFLDPRAAPTPERPAARSLSFITQASRASFSPAGPVPRTLAAAVVAGLRVS